MAETTARGRVRLSELQAQRRRLEGRIRARYDAAQTTDENRRHWSAADALSADAAAAPDVRRTLRMRGRYEVANNSYARGIVLTLANDTVGRGPRLQLLTRDKDVNRLVEREFAAHAREIRFAPKLRTMRMSRAESGEVFAFQVTNPRLASPVKLDIRIAEADQVADPLAGLVPDPASDDGIRFDAAGNPTEYHLLRQHPGAASLLGMGTEGDWIPAHLVWHFFRADRPGQRHGVPDITPALPLFAQLRRYTLAVISAAETAADFAAVLESDASTDAEDAEDPEVFDKIELARRMMTTLPRGWKLGQIRSEQPTTTYGDFVERILNEIARCLNMPFNVAAANSAKYNYASGRLDHQVYHKSIRVDRSELEYGCDWYFDAWLTEALRIPGYLPGTEQLADFPHRWFWDGFEHVDPAKVANARATALASGFDSIPDIYAEAGQDWEEAQALQAQSLGLSLEDYRARLAVKLLGTPTPLSPPDPEEGEDGAE